MNKLALVQMTNERRVQIVAKITELEIYLENVRDVTFDENEELIEIHWVELKPHEAFWTKESGVNIGKPL